MPEPVVAPYGHEPVAPPPAETRPAPLSPTRLNDLRYELHAINRTADPQKKAREMAEEQLREAMRKGNWFNKIGLRIFEEYHRQKLTQRALEAMIANNNSYLSMDVMKNAAVHPTDKIQQEREAEKAKVEQVTEMVKQKQESGVDFAGQKIEAANVNVNKLMIDHLLKPLVIELQALSPQALTDISQLSHDSRRPIEARLQQTLRTWIKAIDDPQVLNGLDPQIKALLSDATVKNQLISIFGRDNTAYKVLANYFATDFIDIGQKMVSDQRAIGSVTIEQLLAKANITLANTSWGAETQAQFNSTDRFIAKMQSNRITGAIFNPAVVGAASSLITGLLMRAPTEIAKRALFVAPIVGMVSGGAVAALRRSYDLKVDRAAHQVDRVYGGKKVTRADVDAQLAHLDPFKRWLAKSAGAYRRADLEKFAYFSRSVPDLVTGVAESLQDLSTDAKINALALKVADIRARLDVSSSEKIDLIEFTGKEQAEQGRLALIKAIAQSKVEMRRTLQQSGLDIAGINTAMQNFEQRIDGHYTSAKQSFIFNREQQDQEFFDYRLGQALKAGVRGAACGLAAGLITEEGIALARRGIGILTDHGVPSGNTSLEKGTGWILDKLGVDRPGFLVERPTTNVLHDLFTNGGSVPFDARHVLSVDASTHAVTITDKFGNVINKDIPIFSTADGHLVTGADLKSLPQPIQEVLSKWGPPSDTLQHSVIEQVKNAVAAGQPEVINQGNFKINIAANGDVDILNMITSQTVKGTVDANGIIHLVGADRASIQAIQTGLANSGFNTGLIGDKSIIAPGGDPIEAFKKLGLVEKAKRILWHGNDTPMHLDARGILVGADGKELQGHFYAQPDGSVDLDMSQMQSQMMPPKGWTNWDGSVDSQYGRLVKDIIPKPDGSRNYQNFEWLITPNDAADKAREVIRLTIGPDGHVKVPPGTDLSQFFKIENGQVVQLARFAEVAHIEYDASGNIIGRTILATSVGHGIDEIIPVNVPNFNLDITPPSALEFVAPTASTPLIIPFVPRYPLPPIETLAQTLPIPPPEYSQPPREYGMLPPEYYSYPGQTGDSVKDYINWIKRSGFYPTEAPYIRDSNGNLINKDGSPIVRNIQRERESISTYLSRQNNGHRALIKQEADKMKPMGEDCRIAVTIPAYLEGKNIYHTLSEWANQYDDKGNKIDKRLYEIDIFINGPTGYKKDNTLEEIKRFKRDNPDMRINAIEREINVKGGNVGLARKILTDAVLLRSLERTRQTGSLFIESEDADLMEIDRKAVFNLLKKFEERPYLDALRGKQDLTPTILMENDYLFFDRRVERIIEYLFRDYRLKPENNPDFDFYWNRVITGGWNTAFTAESYTLIGGYQPARVGEDVDIGRRISIMRGDKDRKGNIIPNVDTIDTVRNVGQSNPRRFINALIRKMPAYADFTNEQINREIREMPLDHMMRQLDFGKRIADDNKASFEEILTNARTFLRWKVPDTTIRDEMFKRLMVVLGFSKYKEVTNPDGTVIKLYGDLKQEGVDKDQWKPDYHIDDKGKVVIDNIKNIKDAFEKYRQEHIT